MLAVDDGVPPPIVIIDESGALHLAVVDSWTELATKDPMSGAKPGDLHGIYMAVMEGFFLDTPPREALARLPDPAAKQKQPPSPSGPRDDPPPPEDEMQELEQEVPESGRKEGQYKMKRAVPQHVVSGDRGRLAKRAGGRAARIAGEVVTDGKLRQQVAAIMAAPRAKAAALIDIEKARAAQKLDTRAPVDVLVEGDVDAQRLVDLIVALATTGVTMIGLGP